MFLKSLFPHATKFYRVPIAALMVALAAVCTSQTAAGLVVFALSVLFALVKGLDKPRVAIDWIAALFFSLTSGTLVALLPPDADIVPTLTISATGLHNPASKAAEVWIQGIGNPSTNFKLNKLSGNSWEKRENAMVSYRDQPSTIEWKGSWKRGDVLRLTRHPFSGIVEVDLDGKKQTYDLYAEHQSFIDIRLPEPQFSLAGSILHYVLIAAAASMGAGFMLVVPIVSAFAKAVFAIAAFASVGTFWLLQDVSTQGSLEIVVLHRQYDSLQPASLQIDAGHGFNEALSFPFKSLPAANVLDLPRKTEPVTVNINRQPIKKWVRQGDGRPNTESIVLGKGNEDFILEFEPNAQPTAGFVIDGESLSIQAPPAPSETHPDRKLFLVGKLEKDRLQIGWTRSYLHLSSWDYPTHKIQALRSDSVEFQQRSTVFRLSSQSGFYQELSRAINGKDYKYPSMDINDTHATKARKIMASLIVFIGIIFIVPLKNLIVDVKELKTANNSKVGISIFIVILLGSGLGICVVSWPSIFDWDAFSPIIQHGTGGINLWYGLGYPLIISGFLYLYGPEASLIFKAILFIFLFAQLSVLALNHGLPKLIPVLIFLFGLLFTAFPLSLATELRDTLNGILLTAYGVCVHLTLVYRKGAYSQPHWSLFILLASGAALLTLNRIDNIVFIFVVLLAVLVVSRTKSSFIGIAFVLGVCLSINPIVERLIMQNSQNAKIEKRLYQVTAYINPLIGFLVEGNPTPEEHKQLTEILTPILDVQYAVKHWTPYNVIYWHEKNKGSPSKQSLKAMKKAYIQLAVSNPSTFIRIRTATLLGTLQAYDLSRLLLNNVPNENLNMHPGFYDHFFSERADHRRYIQLAGFSTTHHLYDKSVKKVMNWSSKVAPPVLQLVVVLICIGLLRRTPITGFIALACLTRLAIFWLFAPASVFFYLCELQFLGMLLPLMAWIELRRNRMMSDI